MAVLPTLCASLGLWPEEERPDVSRREGFLPVARAAAQAAAEGGTEVTAAMPTGPSGPWALLKRRRRRRVTTQDPAPLSAALTPSGSGRSGAEPPGAPDRRLAGPENRRTRTSTLSKRLEKCGRHHTRTPVTSDCTCR